MVPVEDGDAYCSRSLFKILRESKKNEVVDWETLSKAGRRLGEKRTERWKAVSVSVSVCSFVMAWPGYVDSSQSEQSEEQESQRHSRRLKVEEAKNRRQRERQ
jgi:hypothetical protein